MRPVLLALLFATACTASPPAFCEGTTEFAWDPVLGDQLGAFPDDFYTFADPTTPTGLRVAIDDGNAPWLQGMSHAVRLMFADLSKLDGFGTSAAVELRFTGKLGDVATGAVNSVTSDAIRFIELGPDGPKRIAFETEFSDGGATLLLWPMRPLRPKTRHAVVVTRAQTDAAGHCVSPSPPLRDLLLGGNGVLAPMAPRVAEVMKALALEPGDVSALTVFTTQSIEDETTAVATDVSTRAIQWKEAPTCERLGTDLFKTCRGTFLANRYSLEPGDTVDGTPKGTYELPVALWLPISHEGPIPFLVYGHGLGDDKDAGRYPAIHGATHGYGTVAIDATKHGEHPTSDPNLSIPGRVLEFFGIDLGGAKIHALTLRDDLRVSTWDKLQVLRLLTLHPDVDGDGTDDFDPARVAYHGLSLGGIMGPELLASSPLFGAVSLTVPGGRLSSIVAESPAFFIALPALRGIAMTDGDQATILPLLQTLIERGDPVNSANHVMRDRHAIGGPTAPHLLMGYVIGDETVTNGANRALARSFDLPLMPPVAAHVDGLTALEQAPVQGNLEGNVTGAVFQFDRVGGQSPEPATHSNIWFSPEEGLQRKHFFETWIDGGTPEIVDPYATLHTPPLHR